MLSGLLPNSGEHRNDACGAHAIVTSKMSVYMAKWASTIWTKKNSPHAPTQTARLFRRVCSSQTVPLIHRFRHKLRENVIIHHTCQPECVTLQCTATGRDTTLYAVHWSRLRFEFPVSTTPSRPRSDSRNVYSWQRFEKRIIICNASCKRSMVFCDRSVLLLPPPQI